MKKGMKVTVALFACVFALSALLNILYVFNKAGEFFSGWALLL